MASKAEVEALMRKHNLAPPWDGPDPDLVAAQRSLGVALPPSYAWWLQRYPFAEVGSVIIYGLDETGFGFSLTALHTSDSGRGIVREHRLRFAIGDGEEFAFDLSERRHDGECPVVLDEGGAESRHADDFLEFVVELVSRFYPEK